MTVTNDEFQNTNRNLLTNDDKGDLVIKLDRQKRESTVIENESPKEVDKSQS